MLRQERIDSPNDMLLAAFEGLQSGIWTALPGVVQSFDNVAMTCSVQPSIMVKVQDKDYTEKWVNLPVLIHVPVVFPNAGGCHITFPVKAGDEVLVVFASRCIDAWWQSGGVNNQQAEFRMHDLSDGFALPGPRSQPRVIGAVSTTEMQIRSDDGQSIIAIDPATHDVKITTSAKLVVNTTGDMTATVGGNMQSTVTGNMQSTVTGNIQATCAQATLNASSQVSVTSPSILMTGAVVVTGSLTVSGLAALNGGMTVPATGGATATIAAPMTMSGTTTMNGTVAATSGMAVTGALTNNGVNVGSTHTHAGVTTGGGNTAVPN
jgi:hypothetical protein